MYRIGHRGAAGHAPENTLRSVKKAIEIGVDFVEIDVQATKNGDLVVIHDKLVDRTTSGQGYVSDMTFEELRVLDAGEGERIPALAEILALSAGITGLMLEIITPGIGRLVYETVKKSEFAGPVIFASFLHAELRSLREIDGAVSCLALLEGVPIDATAFARDARVSHVGLASDSITSEFIARLRAEGFVVFAYTVNHPSEIQRMKSMEVDGIVSDFPERL